MSTKDPNSKKYQKIPYETRRDIITAVIENGQKVASVSRQFEVKDSTVRAIIKIYQEKGIIFERKAEKDKRKIV